MTKSNSMLAQCSDDIVFYPGNYTVEAMITEPGYSGSLTCTLSITKIEADVTISGTSGTYNGLEQGVAVTTVPTSHGIDITYNGSTEVPVNAGFYNVVATINDAHYQGTAQSTLKINKAVAGINFINEENVFNGLAQEAVIETTPSDLSYDISYNVVSGIPVSIGIYEIIVSVKDSNYDGLLIDILKIEKAVARILITEKETIYDGTQKEVEISTIPKIYHT